MRNAGLIRTKQRTEVVVKSVESVMEAPSGKESGWDF